MPESDSHTRARGFLTKAQENATAARRCADAGWRSATAASAIRAGKSAADAITVALAGRTVTHLAAVRAADELAPILRGDRECVYVVMALHELMYSEPAVCGGHEPTSADTARALVAHAETLIEVARRVV